MGILVMFPTGNWYAWNVKFKNGDKPLALLGLQSRVGDKPHKFQVECPEHGTAVLQGSKQFVTGTTTLARLCQWDIKVSIKSLDSEDTCQKVPGTACYEHDSSNGKFQTLGKSRKKTIPGPILGRDLLQKNSGGCLAGSSEIPSPRQISIHKTNDCAMNCEPSALVRGSDPSKGQGVHTMAGDMWQALARRMVL